MLFREHFTKYFADNIYFKLAIRHNAHLPRGKGDEDDGGPDEDELPRSSLLLFLHLLCHDAAVLPVDQHRVHLQLVVPSLPAAAVPPRPRGRDRPLDDFSIA